MDNGFAFAEKNATDFATALGCDTPRGVLHIPLLPLLGVNVCEARRHFH